ncbi:substrate-binding domain-containing protein [Aeromonas sp.]|uniref:substrate-binding domain-containing protein n=1 Tax=Aeromonas sp. TaxID=647 RepID=UPI002589FBFF|nr:substrate-binding domain-containing protein [Aeromonas sp.]MCX7134620.1 substrate-binding domain-containing protein [Aeromonas sp.]
MITGTVRQRLALALSTALLLGLPLLSAASYAESAKAPIRLATTTSTEQSGLLGWLLPQFTKETGYPVQVMAAGTGQSLKMGENGDADLLQAIKDKKQTFISRGDESGTHIKEKTLWQAADVKPEFAGYKSIGQGMGPTLTMASELGAYTLTDRGTWLAYQSKLDLAVLLEGDKRLFNPYQVILVNPKRYPDLNTEGARTLKNWLVSEHGQTLIGDFKVAGQALFVADANGK